ncbi:2-hydroxy-3-oxopropionate reductase [Pectinatus cerevisiiphilus]|uniref:2-hydroxy-3-oxopropionate reductase n=1 Tax=Pectinatus cerevisiiphilus TaxID=86956 RepID=A0A4R3K6G1_9FIRM|nr:2-hydroxy-3-oxopropionate reductase [Pectinatus cerevisiiphilus]TCS78395.1 2-hydroxy-3-oxopropionate reductase [Pectinatus cerevisiiphilus]
MSKVGFIGLGIMGKPMVKNLLQAGIDTTVYDISENAMAILAKEGAKTATSPKEVASNKDVVITMVPNAAIVKSLLEGQDGILAGACPGTVIVDMSSVSPVASQEFAKLAAEKNCPFLDSPVSGGEPGAIDGTLAFMIGGEEKTVEKIKYIFEAMGKSITVVGPNGSGSVAKLANQIMVNLNIAAVSEALVLAQKAGADPKKVYEAVRGGLAGSTVLDAKAPMMYSRNFKPGGTLAINLKDITNVMDTAKSLNVPLILTSSLQQIMLSLKANGHIMDDHSGIVQFYEKISDVIVKSQE